VPLSTVYPRSALLLGIAGFAGTGLGLALVLVLGHVDDRLRTGEEIRRWLDVTYLGNVPTVPRKLLRRSEVVTDQAGADGFSESLRMVRTNLAFFCEQGMPRVIVVTSTSRGEGKTLVATNLAVALAQARQRVLLVDGDMRRPRLHEIFAVERGPGLADLLSSPELGTSVLRETQQPNLTLMAAGSEPAQTADLLGFDPITQLLAALDRTFDWVIVDSPPVDAATDACLLAHRVSRVLFVVAGRRVSRTAARTAVDRLSASGADFVGAVLTRMHAQPQDYQPY
jgi:polysaccharide biosynthesis transport protein